MSGIDNGKDINEELKRTLEELKDYIGADIREDEIDQDLYKLLNLQELLSEELNEDDEDEDDDEHRHHEHKHKHCKHHLKEKLLIEIILLLINKKFGLKEIKKEIKIIETAVGEVATQVAVIDTAVAGIETTIGEVATQVGFIDTNIGKILTGVGIIETIITIIPTIPFGEIATQVAIIDTNVSEIATQVAVIDTAVAGIETTIGEVATQVGFIDTNIGKILTVVGIIETIITIIPTIPFGEIATQVAIIDTNVSEIATQVAVIDTNVAVIETIVSVIETLIAEKICGGCTSGRLTTGPVLLDNGVNSFVLKVLNDSVATLPEVDAFLFNIETCPRLSIFEATFVNIPPKCSEHVVVGKPGTDLPDEFEIQFAGVTTDVFVSVAARSNAANAPIKASEIREANSFRHSELSCTNDP